MIDWSGLSMFLCLSFIVDFCRCCLDLKCAERSQPVSGDVYVIVRLSQNIDVSAPETKLLVCNRSEASHSIRSAKSKRRLTLRHSNQAPRQTRTRDLEARYGISHSRPLVKDSRYKADIFLFEPVFSSNETFDLM